MPLHYKISAEHARDMTLNTQKEARDKCLNVTLASYSRIAQRLHRKIYVTARNGTGVREIESSILVHPAFHGEFVKLLEKEFVADLGYRVYTGDLLYCPDTFLQIFYVGKKTKLGVSIRW